MNKSNIMEASEALEVLVALCEQIGIAEKTNWQLLYPSAEIERGLKIL